MDDGSTARQHAEAFERQTGQKAPELNGPELPPDLVHLWGWFLELHSRRGGNGFGANPLSWSDLYAWVSLTQPLITPQELRAVMALDSSWMALQAENVVSKRPKPGVPESRSAHR